MTARCTNGHSRNEINSSEYKVTSVPNDGVCHCLGAVYHLAMKFQFAEQTVRDALKASWSIESARQWTPDNPAAGQCNVTAAVVQELFGGEILKTALDEGFHFYNRIGGLPIDFTGSQFANPIAYDDASSDRDEALSGIPKSEYDALTTAVINNLRKDRAIRESSTISPSSAHS